MSHPDLELSLAALTIEEPHIATIAKAVEKNGQRANYVGQEMGFADRQDEPSEEATYDRFRLISVQEIKETSQVENSPPKIKKIWRYKSVNFFDHQFLFRVVYPGSPPRSEKGDVRSRLYPPPVLEDLPDVEAMEKLKKYAYDHRWGIHHEGPFISTTTDILRAFNCAWRLLCKGGTGIRLLVIDSWKLHPGSYVDGNQLQIRVGLQTNHLFDTETIVWGEIPAEALVYDWSWESLQHSGLFELFPGLIMNGQPAPGNDESRTLQSLRDNISSHTKQFEVPKLVGLLVDRLGMPPSAYLTLQMARILLGWRKGGDRHLLTHSYKYLEGRLGYDDLRMLKSKLHQKELEIGHKKKEKKLHFLEEEQIDTASFHDSLMLEIDKSHPPSVTEWWETLEAKFISDQDIHDQLPRDKHGFEKFLLKLRVMPVRRSARKSA